MTADEVVNAEEGVEGEEEGGMVLALRDAAGAVQDVVVRVGASTTVAQVWCVCVVRVRCACACACACVCVCACAYACACACACALIHAWH